MTGGEKCSKIDPCTTVLSADPHEKGDNNVDQQKITILYCRLSNEDLLEGESNSVQNQYYVVIRVPAICNALQICQPQRLFSAGNSCFKKIPVGTRSTSAPCSRTQAERRAPAG